MKSLLKLPLALLIIGICGCTEPPFGLNSIGSPQTPATLRPRAVNILKNSFSDRNPYMRIHAIEVAATTQCKEMAPYIHKCLRDSELMVRFAAVLAMGDLQCIGYEDQVRKLLKDVDTNIQIAAAYTLARLNHPEHIAVIRAAAYNTDQTVRANAILLLGKLGSQEDIDFLYTIMNRKDSTDKVRMQAVESIARLGDDQIYRTKLWALLISKYADDRVMGIRGMGALATPEAENAILTMLSDDVLEVRLAAAEELGRIGNYAGLYLVTDYFQEKPDLDHADMANSMAIRALGRIPSTQLQVYLPNILNSQSGIIRLLGAQATLLLAP